MTGKTIEAIEACNCGQKPAFDGTNEPHWHRNSCPIYRPPPKKPVVTIESLAAELKQLREFVGAEKALADLAQDVCDVFCPVNEREELAYRKLREALRPYTEAK